MKKLISAKKAIKLLENLPKGSKISEPKNLGNGVFEYEIKLPK